MTKIPKNLAKVYFPKPIRNSTGTQRYIWEDEEIAKLAVELGKYVDSIPEDHVPSMTEFAHHAGIASSTITYLCNWKKMPKDRSPDVVAELAFQKERLIDLMNFRLSNMAIFSKQFGVNSNGVLQYLNLINKTQEKGAGNTYIINNATINNNFEKLAPEKQNEAIWTMLEDGE